MEQLKALISYDLSNEIIKNLNLNETISKEQIDTYLDNALNILNKKPLLLEKFITESSNHISTKYHEENLITHLYTVGWISALFSSQFNLEPEFAFQIGFFHDIGKPFAKKHIDTKKKIIASFKGHAQVGENICTVLGLDDKICWVTSNHMCSCCHENNTMNQWQYTASLQTLAIAQTEMKRYAESLACLMIADDLGRIGIESKNVENIINHSKSWLEWFTEYSKRPLSHSIHFLQKLHPDNSIIVHMYGHSGFGKSHASKRLIEELKSRNISWDYAERDTSYYAIYSQTKNIPIENITDDYQTVYKYIQDNDLKYAVQQNWVEQLNAVLDSDSKVKIIDTVQLMYPKGWEPTLASLNPDAYSTWKSSIKFGYYGFPQSLYGNQFEPKTGQYELIPRDINDAFTYPQMNAELDRNIPFNPEFIDIAYGSFKFLLNSILNYNMNSKMYIPEKQVHLMELLESADKSRLSSAYIQEYIQNQFPPQIVLSNNEYVKDGNYLIRFIYRDGMQIFNGPSRDYRGETILFNEMKGEYCVGRVSLPVFPDYADIRKDPIAKDMINNCSTFHIVPKFDGSLFVLSLIKQGTLEYDIIKKILPMTAKEAWFENEMGIWAFGSKGCMFAKNQHVDDGVLNRILNSVIASYGTVTNFIECITNELNANKFADIYTNISLTFEAIDKRPTDELTVLYDNAFCPFLCWILFDKNTFEKKIILPTSQTTYLNPIAQITTVSTWEEVIQFKDNAHVRLIDGSIMDEPEGYVVWLNDSNIGVKLKHPEYYVAHKPYSKKNVSKAKEIEFSEEYSKLRKRLLKFQPKPLIADLLDTDMLINFFDSHMENNNENCNSKKNWALYWKNNLMQLEEITKEFEIKLTTHYPIFKNTFTSKSFSLAMEYYDNRENYRAFITKRYLTTTK